MKRIAVLALLAWASVCAAGLAVDERPAVEGEWGYRPAEGEAVAVNPPRFSWRPQKDAASYVVEASRDRGFKTVDYSATKLEFNVHAPAKVFEPGEYFWRFRYTNAAGETSEASSVRAFHIPPAAVKFPIPDRGTLLARIPDAHPRLFVRPEQLPSLRERTKEGGDLHDELMGLLVACDRWVAKPPKLVEPPKYPPGIEVKSEQWRTIWQAGMQQTPAMLDPIVNLGLAYHLTGERKYGDLGKRMLLEVLKWDPKGSTGYRYNDEAGMPYNYLFARGYTYLNALLSDEEKAECRRVMTIRGKEMYEHLRPTHLWQPYESHRNRAWHFLGEVGIAFHGEIPEADDWTWFAINVFANTYPVWSDSDGGWHEGLAYWRSYMNRFSWWADAMRSAMGLDAYQLPYFSQVGYYPMYLQPPGTTWGGFGDQNVAINSSGSANIMVTFAAQARNPHWMWYAEHCATPASAPGAQAAAINRQWEPVGYLSLLRAASYPKVEPKAPTDLPTSRVFHGIGQAFLNTDLMSAADNTEVLFKSSPFGTQSHGYNANNSFELYSHGLPLLLSTGQRDIYGSDHHANWMWETKSCNNILVSGKGQIKHSRLPHGRITAFSTSKEYDRVQGDAAGSYEPALKRYTRDILFLKPDYVVIYDRLESTKAETWQYLLHAPNPFDIHDNRADVTNQSAACQVTFLLPGDMRITQTDKFSPPPRERIKLVQHHLTADPQVPSEGQEFLTVVHVGPPTSTAPVFATEQGLHTLRVGRHTIKLSWDGDPEIAVAP